MKLADFSRLKKFMALTTSDNDAEALAALRQANKVLAANRLTWEQVFSRTVKTEGPSIEEVSTTDRMPNKAFMAARIEQALQKVLDNTREGSFRDFILDLEAQWQDKRWLTPNQREALFKAEGKLA